MSFSLQRRSKAKQINPNSGSSSKKRRSQFQRSSPSSSPSSPPLRLRSLSPAAPISVEVPDDSRVVTCTPCNGYMHLQCKYRRRFRRRSTSHSAAPHQLKNYLDCWFVMKLFIPNLEVSIARSIGDEISIHRACRRARAGGSILCNFRCQHAHHCHHLRPPFSPES